MKNIRVEILTKVLIECLALCFLLIIPKQINSVIILAIIFSVISLILSMVAGVIARRFDRKSYLPLPIMTVGWICIVLELVISLVVSLVSTIVPFKFSLIICVVIIAVEIFAIIASTAKNDHIEQLESRLKNNHREL